MKQNTFLLFLLVLLIEKVVHAYLDLRFQERLDERMTKYYQPSFLEPDPPLYNPAADDQRCLTGEEKIFDWDYGIFGVRNKLCVGQSCCDTWEAAGCCWPRPPGQNPSTLFALDGHASNYPSLTNVFGRIILYISENWHKTVKMIEEKLSPVEDRVTVLVEEVETTKACLSIQETYINQLQNQLAINTEKMQQQQHQIDELRGLINTLSITGQGQTSCLFF